MAAFNITIADQTADATTLKLGFGDPAQNDAIVRDAIKALKDLALPGGKIIKLNGPASLPVAVAIAHGLVHIYGVVAVFDPKLSKFVVSVSHDPSHNPGDLID
jgi:CRISPR-associated protein Csx3